jgi:methyl-accepting chemotaxis protein
MIAYEATEVMQTSYTMCGHTVENAEKTANALEEILSSINTIDQMNSHIAGAAEQESIVTQKAAQSVNSINDQSVYTSTKVNKAVSACKEVNDITDKIYDKLAQFKV